MHHGACVTHAPWCMSGSFTCGGRGNVPGIPGACAPAILRIRQEAHGVCPILFSFRPLSHQMVCQRTVNSIQLPSRRLFLVFVWVTVIHTNSIFPPASSKLDQTAAEYDHVRLKLHVRNCIQKSRGQSSSVIYAVNFLFNCFHPATACRKLEQNGTFFVTHLHCAEMIWRFSPVQSDQVAYVWDIRLPTPYQINITVLHFYFVHSAGCVRDRLQVQQEFHGAPRLQYRYCGALPPWTMFSESNTVRLEGILFDIRSTMRLQYWALRRGYVRNATDVSIGGSRPTTMFHIGDMLKVYWLIRAKVYQMIKINHVCSNTTASYVNSSLTVYIGPVQNKHRLIYQYPCTAAHTVSTNGSHFICESFICLAAFMEDTFQRESKSAHAIAYAVLDIYTQLDKHLCMHGQNLQVREHIQWPLVAPGKPCHLQIISTLSDQHYIEISIGVVKDDTTESDGCWYAGMAIWNAEDSHEPVGPMCGEALQVAGHVDRVNPGYIYTSPNNVTNIILYNFQSESTTFWLNISAKPQACQGITGCNLRNTDLATCSILQMYAFGKGQESCEMNLSRKTVGNLHFSIYALLPGSSRLTDYVISSEGDVVEMKTFHASISLRSPMVTDQFQTSRDTLHIANPQYKLISDSSLSVKYVSNVTSLATILVIRISFADCIAVDLFPRKHITLDRTICANITTVPGTFGSYSFDINIATDGYIIFVIDPCAFPQSARLVLYDVEFDVGISVELGFEVLRWKSMGPKVKGQLQVNSHGNCKHIINFRNQSYVEIPKQIPHHGGCVLDVDGYRDRAYRILPRPSYSYLGAKSDCQDKTGALHGLVSFERAEELQLLLKASIREPCKSHLRGIWTFSVLFIGLRRVS